MTETAPNDRALFWSRRRQKGGKLGLFWDGLEAGRGAENQPSDKEGSLIEMFYVSKVSFLKFMICRILKFETWEKAKFHKTFASRNWIKG